MTILFSRYTAADHQSVASTSGNFFPSQEFLREWLSSHGEEHMADEVFRPIVVAVWRLDSGIGLDRFGDAIAAGPDFTMSADRVDGHLHIAMN